MTISVSQAFKSRSISSLSCLVLVVFSLSIAFDSWHAQRFNYTFYWTESMLFGIKWLLFIPGYAVLMRISVGRSGAFGIGSLFALAFAIIHLLTLAYIIMMMNYLFGGHPFEHLLSNLMADNGLFFLLIYLSLVFLPRSQWLAQHLSNEDKSPKYKARLKTTRGGSIYFVDVAKVSLVKSSHGCCRIYLNDGNAVSIDSTLRNLETQLDPLIFCRVHRQTIVRVSEVFKTASRGNGDYNLTLKNGLECRLSRRYREPFRELQV